LRRGNLSSVTQSAEDISLTNFISWLTSPVGLVLLDSLLVMFCSNIRQNGGNVIITSSPVVLMLGLPLGY
jgi:hypothetical protein